MPSYHVDRSIEIDASPEKVFDAVADYGTWTTWSPWLCSEPDAEVIVSDDASSVGSVYAWNGEIVGSGELEHRKLDSGRRIEDEIRFLKPWKSVSNVSFDFEPTSSGTKLTWHMDGSLPWFMFWMKSSMEGFIGMDYDRGLKMLKEWLETGKINSQTKIRGIESVGPVRMAGVSKTCKLKEIGPSMAASFENAKAEFEKQGLPTDVQSLSVYHKFDLKNQTFDYTSGYVIPENASPEQLSIWSLPSCQALCVDHVGSYDHLGNAWNAANAYARYKKLKQSKAGCFELYKNEPGDTPEEQLEVEICLPLR